MNHAFVNKIIGLIIEMIKKIEIKKSMGNNTNKVATIGASTQIVFTVKSFLTTIGAILGIFATFYFTVFEPRADKTEEYQKLLYEQQQKYISDKLSEIKKSIDVNTNAISINTAAIKATNERFRDLNESVEDIANSRGGFGIMGITTYPPEEDNLVSNHH